MLCKRSFLKTTSCRLFVLTILPAILFPAPGWSMPAPALPDSLCVCDTAKKLLPDSCLVESSVVPIGLNKHVAGFVAVYVKREAEFLQKMKERSKPYFRIVEKVFDQYDLPPQLKYLAVVESKLQPTAKSAAGARGLWQLMPVTARELKLKVGGRIDERLQTYRSTVAAACYLRNLYKDFGDWLLVLAAYNSGPGTVYKAAKKAGSKNFWALLRFLPAESRGHVKRFIGIHWYFEGKGSVVTQTKAETAAWQAMAALTEIKQ